MEQPPKIPKTKPIPEVDGRLTRLGISPWVAQRVRDLARRAHRHNDPGGEWPSHSGGITVEERRALDELAVGFDQNQGNQSSR